MENDKKPVSPMTDDALGKRLIDLGKRIPSMAWWYGYRSELGCSPRDAVDAGRVAEVENILTASGW